MMIKRDASAAPAVEPIQVRRKKAKEAAEKANTLAVSVVNAQIIVVNAMSAEKKADMALTALTNAKKSFKIALNACLPPTAAVAEKLAEAEALVTFGKAMRLDALFKVSEKKVVVEKLKEEHENAADAAKIAAAAANMSFWKRLVVTCDVSNEAPPAASLDANDDDDESSDDEDDSSSSSSGSSSPSVPSYDGAKRKCLGDRRIA